MKHAERAHVRHPSSDGAARSMPPDMFDQQKPSARIGGLTGGLKRHPQIMTRALLPLHRALLASGVVLMVHRIEIEPERSTSMMILLRRST